MTESIESIRDLEYRKSGEYNLTPKNAVNAKITKTTKVNYKLPVLPPSTGTLIPLI